MTTLAVITNAGNVYGTNVVSSGGLSPVYEFSGAKIGYNYPQDRFMMATDYSLFVTNNGTVFGATIDLANQSIGAVAEYTGTRIGYNPQDRFMVAAGGTLFVITTTGDVWWTNIGSGETLSPVAHLGGSKIGYNPQDRFMVALGGASMLAVITNTGDVYGAVVETQPGLAGAPQNLGPIIHFSGSKIGYNPQDRFMVISEHDNTLFVITNSGAVFGASVDTQSYSIGPVIQYTGAQIGYNKQDQFMVAVSPIPVVQ